MLCKAKRFIAFKSDSHEVALCLRLTLQGHVSPGEPPSGKYRAVMMANNIVHGHVSPGEPPSGKYRAVMMANNIVHGHVSPGEPRGGK
jgi:hypothetical protein